MILTLVVMAIAMAVTIGFTGLCSFNPGKPENGPVHEVDAQSFLNMESNRVDYPVRMPEVPKGWTSNSTRAGTAAGSQTTIVGFVTASGTFVQVTQTDAPADKLPADGKERLRDGAVDVDGTKWTKFQPTDDNDRRVWVGDLGEVRAMIEGTANDEEFTQLASGLQNAKPIDANAALQSPAPTSAPADSEQNQPAESGAPAN